MSWHFSQALVGEYSGERSLGGKRFVPLSLTPTHGMCWLPGKTTDAFRPSRSGMTCEPLTADRGTELLTWCLADSRARTSAQPERVQELEGNEADSGERWQELLVKFDPASCGWKTARCLWEEGLDWSCLTLPRWGSLHDGELWGRTTPGLRTDGNGSGLWRTPTVSSAERGAMKGSIRLERGQTMSLQDQVADPKMWPTPHGMSKDGKSNGPSGNELGRAVNQAEKFPTPTSSMMTMADMEQARFAGNGGKRPDYATFATPKSRDWKGQSQRGIHAPGDALPNMDRGDGKPVGGSLNPTWVEWLMGWPLGWTDCAVPAMDKFRQWLLSHGKFYTWRRD
jgi:hypothetical protein